MKKLHSRKSTAKNAQKASDHRNHADKKKSDYMLLMGKFTFSSDRYINDSRLHTLNDDEDNGQVILAR